ncbi:MAG: tetratricopeptide repeat protein, partial [Gemmatimonadota bacterium]|nr:tetratricopeptide repeat protein [Gemmatimonadota bacterium]
KHLAERPAPLAQVRPDCPPQLAAAVMRALEKQPSARWQTGGEFREAVRGERVTPVPVERVRKRRTAVLAAAALVGILGFAAVKARGSDGPPDGVNPRHSLLVLPFDNLRNDETTAWLRDASVSMLGLNLSQWNDLTVVDHDRLHDLLARHGLAMGDPVGLEQARQLARDAGVWTVVLGEYAQAGDSLHLVARLYDVETGRRVDVAQAGGVPGEDVRPLFDELAARLLDLSGAPQEISTGLAQATTSSLEAFRSYLAGVEHLSDWDLAAAERQFREAVATDTTFGLAYYKLALTRGWLVGTADSASDAAMVRAVRYSDGLPEHERTIIAAYHAFLNDEYPIARALYERLIARDSQDADAWYGLGEAWFHAPMGPETAADWTRALRAFKRAIALDRDYTLAYDHIQYMLTSASSPQGWLALLPDDSLVSVYAAEGKPQLDERTRAAAVEHAQQDAITLARDWVGSQPTAMRAHGALVDAYLAAGDWGAARREVDRYRALETEHPEEPFIEARIALAAGEPEEAATTLRRALDSVAPDDFRRHEGTPTVLRYVQSAANVFAYQGDLGGAARAIDFADRVQQMVFPEFGGGAMADHWRRQALGELYAAAGGPAGTLRNVWSSAEEASRTAPPAQRKDVLETGATAALGLFIGPAGDSSAIREFQLLSGEPLAREVEALLALSREDTSEARRLLAQPDTAAMKSHYVVYRRPIRAQIHFELGEYDRTLELLEGFEPEMLSVHGFDSRWALVGRVRLLRGAALEKLGRPVEARDQYRLALEQWKDPDPAIEPYVRQAQAGLARTSKRGVG